MGVYMKKKAEDLKNIKMYVATIVKKNNLGNDCYLVSCDHVSVGIIDEETQLFTDQEGNQYSPMSNPWSISLENPYMYDSIVTLDNMKEVAESSKVPLKRVIDEYEEMSKKVLYLVSKTEDGKVLSTTLNTDQLKEGAREADYSEEDTKKGENAPGEITIDNLEELILDIWEGKYTDEELQLILDELKLTSQDIKDVIDYVEMNMHKEEIEEEKETFVDVKKVFHEVIKTLIGQDEASLKLITEIARKELDAREKRQGILLTGGVGVGKTELMNLVDKYTDIPVHRIDSTQLTVPGGYPYGKTIEEELWSLYEECGKNKKNAEKAILFFDEVDSWLSREEECNPDVIRIPLGIMDGKTYQACPDITNPTRTVEINTKNMTVVLGGTYLDKNDLGFLQKSSERQNSHTTMRGFVEKGQMPKTYMGRLTVIKEEIGAHGLSNAVAESTWKALYEVQSNPGVYSEVIMDQEALEDSSHYQLVKKRKKRK